MRDRSVAIALLKRGLPLPIDLVFRLGAVGIDVPKLEARHGQ